MPAPARPGDRRGSRRGARRGRRRAASARATSRASRTTGASGRARNRGAVVGVDVLADDQARERRGASTSATSAASRRRVRRAARSRGRRSRRSRPGGARRRARSCPARCTSRTNRTGARPPRAGSTAVGSSSTSTPRPPCQPCSAAAIATTVRSTGVAWASGTVDVEVDAEAGEDAARLALLLAPEHASASTPRAKPLRSARLSIAFSSRTSPRSWWTKRSPLAAASAWPSANGSPSSSATAPGSGAW